MTKFQPFIFSAHAEEFEKIEDLLPNEVAGACGSKPSSSNCCPTSSPGSGRPSGGYVPPHGGGGGGYSDPNPYQPGSCNWDCPC